MPQFYTVRYSSSSPTSTSIRSSAELSVLPCGSAFNETAASAQAVMQQEIERLQIGQSVAFDLALQIPAKCRLTRSAVTSRTRIG